MTDFSTRAIHAGQVPDAATGAITPPIYLTSTFVQDGIGGLRGGYEYGRSGNPTRDSLETQLAAIEGGTHAFAFSSGLAGEDTLLRSIMAPGDRIVMGNDVYGGTHRLVSRILAPWGIDLAIVELTDLDAVRAAVTPGTKVLWVETPSNPLMKISDITALVEIAHAAGAVAVVDNTFASPALQNPLGFGADIIVHSTTKYIGGHSDVIGGAVITSDDEVAEKLAFHQFAVGAVPSPMDSWLTTRGIKTLGVRMDRHSSNAQAIAERLVAHPSIAAVYYPGLADHPGHAIAARQMRAFGGMVTVKVDGGADAARRFAESTELFALAESLGGVESLIGFPSEMTHASVRGTALEVADDIVRLSVGIEGIDDLIADLEQALEK